MVAGVCTWRGGGGVRAGPRGTTNYVVQVVTWCIRVLLVLIKCRGRISCATLAGGGEGSVGEAKDEDDAGGREGEREGFTVRMKREGKKEVWIMERWRIT